MIDLLNSAHHPLHQENEVIHTDPLTVPGDEGSHCPYSHCEDTNPEDHGSDETRRHSLTDVQVQKALLRSRPVVLLMS